MIVVSDTSVIRYLIEIDCIAVMPDLFQSVLIPHAVWQELRHPMAPAPVKNWIAAPPDWLEIHQVTPQQIPEFDLDPGELEAIALALGKSCPILIDEKYGRRAAVEAGLEVTGLLGVLEKAAYKNLIDIQVALENLSKTQFRVTDELLSAILARTAQTRSN